MSEETKFPTDVAKLVDENSWMIKIAVVEALTAYYARPDCTPEDGVHFLITVVDCESYAGVSDPFYVDLEDYEVEDEPGDGEGE